MGAEHRAGHHPEQAEVALCKSEARYRALLDLLPDPVLIVLPDGLILDANDAAAHLLGCTREELARLSGYEIVAPEVLEETEQQWRRQLGESGQFVVETVWVAQDGSKIPMEVRGRPLQAGDELRFVLIARDQRAQRRAAEVLQASNSLLDKTLASLEEAVFVVEPGARVIAACNPAAERMFGYSREELIGHNTEFLHVDRAAYEEFGRRLFSALDAGGVFHGEYRMKRRDGGVIITEHTVTEIRDDEERRNAAVSVVRDIGERKEAEEALRASEQRYRELVEDINDVIFELDSTGRVTYVSPAVEGPGGYTPSEIVGRPLSDFVHPDDLPALAKECENAISGNPEPSEYRLVAKSRQVVWVRSFSRPIPKDGRIVGLRGVLSNITRRKEAEEALARAREELEGKVERQMLRRNPYGLTFRELTVLNLVAAGRSGREVAMELGISPRTVETHLGNVLAKMGVASRTEAVARALREGLVE